MFICLRRMNRVWSQPLLQSFSFPIYSFSTGQPSGATLSLSPSIFSIPFRIDFIHNTFHYYRMKPLQTTHCTRRRKQKVGSRKKIRPQKGSGRARAGFRYAPRMKGGVKAHGPVPRDFSIKLNKKVVLQGLKATLAAKLFDQTLIIVDNCPDGFKKTKEADKLLKVFGKRYLLVNAQEFSTDFLLATRRLEYFEGVTVDKLNVLNLVKSPKVLITVDAMVKLQGTIERSEKKLYMNRKLYRKLLEEKRSIEKEFIEPVVVKSKVLKDIVKKYELDIQTA